MKGFINLIKPKGMSSAYAVGAVKYKFKVPCGHMGTLDPMAEGVLPVGVGQASRLFQYLLDKEKTYIAKFVFGHTTDTLDVTGQVTESTGAVPTKAQLQTALKEFVGEIEQIPPKYSAKCIDGKRGYQLARKGVEFELAPKKVTILSAELLSQTDEKEFEFKFVVKGGTYIRSLARDIAYKCGTLGTMSALTRSSCGIFSLENGVTVEQFKAEENAEKFLIAPEKTLNFPRLSLTEKQAMKILNGVFENYGIADGIYSVYNEEEFWGVGTAQDGVLKINTYVR
ncbi:MAG: tRNA pseudouridine(55) synthase TruB [Clostridia bacterium]|nr:tRNA pseudouridine(55) synthase TruB [Clostridia bacterium]